MTLEELKDLVTCMDLLEEFFDNSRDKALTWLTIENPHLGEVRPIDFFYLGRGHKVLNFIKTSLDENKLDV
jgi:hypothetical protein